MDTTEQSEKALLADIESLRDRFPQTQDLYREVCAIMFFRYGMTPTANKLYQLVRKGSMSAPAEALNRFWENLREKCRVTVSHPDLPEPLKSAAGDLVATLWATAQASAHETLASFRNDAQVQVDAAIEAETLAQRAQAQAAMALRVAQDDLIQAHLKSDALRHEITALSSTKVAVEAQLIDIKIELAATQTRLDETRSDFGAELAKVRAAAQQSEERLGAAEKRALLEIDRERTTAARLQKTLDVVRAEGKAAAESQRAEYSGLQSQLADSRHAIGVLEGTVKVVSQVRDTAIEERDTSRARLADTSTQLAKLQVEKDALMRQLQAAESKAQEQDAITDAPSRPRRKKPA